MIGAWPLIMGVTMFLQQKLNPQPVDPVQARMFMLLPIVFTYMLSAFPAGLVIYWAWNNLLSIAQQWAIMHRAGRRLTDRSRGEPVAESTSFRRARSSPSELEAGRRLCSRASAGLSPAPPSRRRCRAEGLPEIAFVGRSNVGKSSLVNALTGRRMLARTSNTPGRTRQINFFDARRTADAGRPAGLRLCRGLEERDQGLDPAGAALSARPRAACAASAC